MCADSEHSEQQQREHVVHQQLVFAVGDLQAPTRQARLTISCNALHTVSGACPPPELDRPESEEARAAHLRTHCATVSSGIGVCSAVVRGCTRLGALYVGTSRPSSARAPLAEPTQHAAATAAAERTSTHAKAAGRRERARVHNEVRTNLGLSVRTDL